MVYPLKLSTNNLLHIQPFQNVSKTNEILCGAIYCIKLNNLLDFMNKLDPLVTDRQKNYTKKEEE